MTEPTTSESTGRVDPDRSPFDAKPLDADEYYELLDGEEDYVLRVSDGTKHGTYRFWIENGQLYWRALSWFSPQSAEKFELEVALDDDATTQLLIERDVEVEA